MSPADRPASLHVAAEQPAFRITAGDSVKLAVLHRPDDLYDASVLVEVWEPGGAQPPNSHPASVETFFVLAGTGVAYCDDRSTPLGPGQLLVLPPNSVHRIVNTGAGRLYAVTTMTPDAGFADLVEAGEPTVLDAADLAVLSGPAST